jgi:hypothetical protein
LIPFESPERSAQPLTRADLLDLKTPPANRPGGPPIGVLGSDGDRLPFDPGLPVPKGSAVNIVEPFKVHDLTQMNGRARVSTHVGDFQCSTQDKDVRLSRLNEDILALFSSARLPYRPVVKFLDSS